MSDKVSDVQQTLEYRTDKSVIVGMPLALVMCCLGLSMIAFADSNEFRHVAVARGLAVGGAAWALFLFFSRPGLGPPTYVLSPKGLLYRIPWVKSILIPWQEIHGVDTIEVTAWNWGTRFPRSVTFHDVTVVLITKQFYQTHFHVEPAFQRGPGWNVNFIPKGEMVQVAVHHELVATDAKTLRKAIEMRWRAFRNHADDTSGSGAEDNTATAQSATYVHEPVQYSVKTSGSAKRSTVVAGPVAHRETSSFASTWEKVKIIVPLIGIVVLLTNILGLWATQAQIDSRKEKKKWADWHAQQREQSRKLDEQRKKTDKMWDEFFKRSF